MSAHVPGQLAVDGAPSGRAVVERYGPRPAGVSPIVTTGRTEYLADCPACGEAHRHTTPGIKIAPCGALYTIPAPSDSEQESDPDV